MNPPRENDIKIEDVDLENLLYVYIPVLDDQFTLIELDQTIEDLNKNKSYSGICRMLINVFNVVWRLFFFLIFLT